MTLRLPGHRLWDFWFAQDGDDVHVFYLQAPRDLRRRRVLPDALEPGLPYALDRDDFLVGDPERGRHYAGRLLEHAGTWSFLAWRMHAVGVFLGELSDAMPVEVGPDGALSVRVPQ